jgi:acetyl esterase
VKKGEEYGLSTQKIAYAGDSVGGHMAIGMSTLSAQRTLGAEIVYQAYVFFQLFLHEN